MTHDEFKTKYNLNFQSEEDDKAFFRALDKLYLEYTADKINLIINDYISNADEIFNSMQIASAITYTSIEKSIDK